jgi:hypothetical protein
MESLHTKYTYELKIPFKDYNGNEIKEITCRRPTVADQIAASELGKSASEEFRFAYLYTIISGFSPETLFKMDAVLDWPLFVEAVNKAFLSNSLTKTT